eukprot:scaffold3763_cov165-Amphora_coffeaeformis.AAC.25
MLRRVVCTHGRRLGSLISLSVFVYLASRIGRSQKKAFLSFHTFGRTRTSPLYRPLRLLRNENGKTNHADATTDDDDNGKGYIDDDGKDARFTGLNHRRFCELPKLGL